MDGRFAQGETCTFDCPKFASQPYIQGGAAAAMSLCNSGAASLVSVHHLLSFGAG